MVKRIVLMAAIIMLLFGKSQAGVSVIMNGSFENDGQTIDPITENAAPEYWSDVNIPDGFGGRVKDDWSTYVYEGYSLALYTKWNIRCDAGDKAVVSQQLYLTHISKIIFDLKLSASSGEWDPNMRTALLLIDDELVWNSDEWEPDANNEYHDQEVDVNGIEQAGLHKLSLAIKSDVDETSSPNVEYRTHWDFVKFDTHCGGFGYLPEDLNQDCYVNMLDLEMLAGQWLAEDPNEEYDLYRDGIVDFRDFAFFAEYWMCNTYWENWQDDNCYELGLLATDLNGDGIVNFRDFAILAKDWEPGDYDDISILADEWLLKSWLYGLE